MADLINDKIFIPTKMYDYQAICQKIPPKKQPETVRIQNRKLKEAMEKKMRKMMARMKAAKSSGTPRFVKVSSS